MVSRARLSRLKYPFGLVCTCKYKMVGPLRLMRYALYTSAHKKLATKLGDQPDLRKDSNLDTVLTDRC